MAVPDIPYAYDLFTRITARVTVNGTPLPRLRICEAYNLWNMGAQTAFLEDCYGFSRTRKFEDVAALYGASMNRMALGNFVYGCLAFCSTLVALLAIRFGRPRALVFGVDKASAPGGVDFRIARLYAELARNEMPYTEMLHALLGKDFLRNLWARKRAAIYLEAIDWLYRLVRSHTKERYRIGGLESFDREEALFAEALVHKYVGQMPMRRFRVRFLTRLLRGSRVRTILSIDDTRYYHELMIAGKECGIPSYGFQHGHVTPYHVGWLALPDADGAYARPDFLVVWNEYWKREFETLESVWPPEALLVGGSPNAASSLPLTRQEHRAPYRVLLPCETHAPAAVAAALLRTLASCEDIHVILKVRPDIPVAAQLERLGTDTSSFAVVTHLSELSEPIAAVLGTYSTFLYEAAAAGIPVGVVRSDLAFARRMLENGLAESVDTEDACGAVRALSALPEDEVERRRSMLDYAPEAFSKVCENILA